MTPERLCDFIKFYIGLFVANNMLNTILDTPICRAARRGLRFFMLAIAFHISLLCCMQAHGGNIVEYSVTDSIVKPGLPTFVAAGFGNMGGKSVNIGFFLISPEPFTIYKAEWTNCEQVKEPLEPFELIAKADTVTDKAIAWHIQLQFPYSDTFGDFDQLKIYTDKGVITYYTSPRGYYMEEINDLRKKHDDYVDKAEHHEHNVIIFIGVVAVILISGGVWIFVAVRRHMSRQDLEIEELSTMIEERSELNLELRNKVNALYRTRLDTLNMLCEGYFNNKESDKTKQLFYKDVENTILALRDDKSLEKLEGIVNEYLDDTIARVRQQIPELTMSDLKFLTYIYAGFSPRAVCVFMDIKMKTFYNRRNLLKERILNSNAPDKEYFVSLMSS